MALKSFIYLVKKKSYKGFRKVCFSPKTVFAQAKNGCQKKLERLKKFLTLVLVSLK